MAWFNVDRKGLGKLLRRRGMQFVLFELLQNAWDTNTTLVEVDITRIENRRAIKLSVIDDDPDGFRSLSHAYTLFAESERKAEATKRGRFNLGEKMVLAVCENASIVSTTGSVHFSGNERRHSKAYRASGTQFLATIPMTRAELEQIEQAAKLIIPPVTTFFNGVKCRRRPPLHAFNATLAVELADNEGILRRSRRLTEVRVHERTDDQAWLYEMGIPVVEIDFPWSVEVMQKIPLNLDRDNVTPAYLQEIRVAVMNEMHEHLAKEDAALPEVIKVLEDARTAPEVVNTILTHQYGERRAIFDPSDIEANHQLIAEGYNLIQGRSFSHSAWQQIKSSNAAKPSGQIRPTAKPYGDGPSASFITVWSAGMSNIASFAIELGERLLERQITVRFESGRRGDSWIANYGGGCLTFNYDRLGAKWFEQPRRTAAIIDLIIHELAHEAISSHLDERFYKACTRLGAQAVMLALSSPSIFQDAE